MNIKQIEESRKYRRLRSFFYSLYEAEQELSLIERDKKSIISGAEYDYITSVKLRKEELVEKIDNLIHDKEE